MWFVKMNRVDEKPEGKGQNDSSYAFLALNLPEKEIKHTPLRGKKTERNQGVTRTGTIQNSFYWRVLREEAVMCW